MGERPSARREPRGFTSPISNLNGVGPARAAALEADGIWSVGDLLWWLPFRYEDRRWPTAIAEAKADQTALLQVTVKAVRTRRSRDRRLSITEALVSDATGNLCAAWFNRPYLQKILKPGANLLLYGRLGVFPVGGGMRLQIENPEMEKPDGGKDGGIHTGRIVPVYRKVGGLGCKALRKLIFEAFDSLEIQEFLPEALLREEDLPGRKEAFFKAHFPSQDSDFEVIGSRKGRAISRLVFEELLGGQMVSAVARLRRGKVGASGIKFGEAAVMDLARKAFPHELTGAQRKALLEIWRDLRSDAPMYRLLQGDVGSGKTIVAFLSMLAAGVAGRQAAFMAPTEVLAAQQFEKLEGLVGGSGFSVTLLTSSVKGRAREDALSEIASGECAFAVGTHSLFQKGVSFKDLAMVVIDEQHRFGVEQRCTLAAKGRNPNVLVMSATPIPRSLAMTIYGDMSISVIDELPPGRSKIVTAVREEAARPKVETFLKAELAAGHQVFVVYPLVEEAEGEDAQAAIQAHKSLTSGPFRGYPAALLHGKLPPSEKLRVARDLREGKVKLLVATTIVEVGVDLPEATVMVVESAERFGLSQLHQLRGRVGRGGAKGYCILMPGPGAGEEGITRLKVLEKVSDGFRIAEEDLRARGAGNLAGTGQWGWSGFKIAHPLADFDILSRAKVWAERLTSREPGIGKEELDRLREWVRWLEGSLGKYSRVG